MIANGERGDIIDINLPELLIKQFGMAAYSGFELPDAIAGGTLATVGGKLGTKGARIIVNEVASLPPNVSSDTIKAGSAFTFYVVPDVDSKAIRGGADAGSSIISIPFRYIRDKTPQFGIVKVLVGSGYTSFESKVQSPLHLGPNTHLATYRVQQRLAYLGFPGWKGQEFVDTFVGAGSTPPKRHTWGAVNVDVDGTVVAGDETDYALRLFKATVKSGGTANPFPGMHNSVTEGPLTNELAWLNVPTVTEDGVVSSSPPRWRELKENGPFLIISPTKGNVIPVTLVAEQSERFATSWALDVIDTAYRALRKQRIAVVITSLSDEYGDTQNEHNGAKKDTPKKKDNRFEHDEHKAGLDIDVHIPYERMKKAETDGDLDALMRLEQETVKSVRAFYKAAVAAGVLEKVILGVKEDDKDRMDGTFDRSLPRLHDLLTTGADPIPSAVLTRAADHHHHFHVSLKPPTLHQTLRAALAPATSHDSTSFELLSSTDVKAASRLTESLTRWETRSGVILEATQALLDGIDVESADLTADLLGLASGSLITVDRDAAGFGWFIDTTPGDDSEFVKSGDRPFGVAPLGSPAFGRVDLLSVVAHELGHILGFDHVDDEHHTMGESLAVGVRRVPFWIQTVVADGNDEIAAPDSSQAVTRPATHATASVNVTGRPRSAALEATTVVAAVTTEQVAESKVENNLGATDYTTTAAPAQSPIFINADVDQPISHQGNVYRPVRVEYARAKASTGSDELPSDGRWGWFEEEPVHPLPTLAIGRQRGQRLDLADALFSSDPDEWLGADWDGLAGLTEDDATVHPPARKKPWRPDSA